MKKLDLKGKIAIVLDGFPGHVDTASVGYKKFKPEGRYASYYLERNKTERLQKAGAIAEIHIVPGADMSVMWAKNQVYPVKGDYYEADERLDSYYNYRMTLPGDTLNADIPVFMVTPRVANEIIAGAGINFTDFEKKVTAELKPASQALPGKYLQFKTTVDSKIIKARNVLGYIEGKKKMNLLLLADITTTLENGTAGFGTAPMIMHRVQWE